MAETTGATPKEVAFVFLAFGFMTLVGNVLAAQLAKKWSAFRTSAVFAVCVLAGVAIWTTGTGVYGLMAAGAATWGLGFAAVSGMQQARLMAAAPHLASASVAINNTVLYFGQALGSEIGGFLFTHGDPKSMGYAAVALVATGLVMVWLSRNVPEKFSGAMDADTVQLLARAFDQALDQHRALLPSSKVDWALNAKLAGFIVAIARAGERDEAELARRGNLMLQSLQAGSSTGAASSG